MQQQLSLFDIAPLSPQTKKPAGIRLAVMKATTEKANERWRAAYEAFILEYATRHSDFSAEAASLFSRRFQGFFNIPFKMIDSSNNCAVSNFQLFTPQRKRLSLSVHRYVTILGSVIHLLLDRCPTAIFRKIVSVSVYSVETMLFGRRFAHISIEIFKRARPLFANLYSAPAVVRVTNTFNVLATIFHTAPNSVNPCPSFSVSLGSGSKFFPFPATTTCGFANAQPVRVSRVNASALATAIPMRVSLFTTFEANNSKPSKFLTFKVKEGRSVWFRLENYIRILFSHLFSTSLENGLIRLVREVQTHVRAVLILPQNPYLSNRHNSCLVRLEFAAKYPHITTKSNQASGGIFHRLIREGKLRKSDFKTSAIFGNNLRTYTLGTAAIKEEK